MENSEAIGKGLVNSSGTSTVRQVLKKLRGGFLVVIGFLLSPLSWWNDLFFNLPIAYGFGYLLSRFSPDLLFPLTIVGYWLSNILGILLMQLGVFDVMQDDGKERNLKKELMSGVVTSTIYTIVIALLVHFNVLHAPDLFAEGNSLNFDSFLSLFTGGNKSL